MRELCDTADTHGAQVHGPDFPAAAERGRVLQPWKQPPVRGMFGVNLKKVP